MSRGFAEESLARSLGGLWFVFPSERRTDAAALQWAADAGRRALFRSEGRSLVPGAEAESASVGMRDGVEFMAALAACQLSPLKKRTSFSRSWPVRGGRGSPQGGEKGVGGSHRMPPPFGRGRVRTGQPIP